MTGNANPRSALLMRADSLICAIPLEHVTEVMRPQPVEAMAAVPDFVRGLVVVRGEAMPVISLATLLNAQSSAADARFVSCRAGERRFALTATEVLGVHGISSPGAEELPPLLQHARNEAVQGIKVLDGQLLLLLNAGRIVPEEVWHSLHHDGN